MNLIKRATLCVDGDLSCENTLLISIATENPLTESIEPYHKVAQDAVVKYAAAAADFGK